MVDSDFDKPLGLDRSTAPSRFAIPYKFIAFSGLGLLGLALFGFISVTGDPMGGEPYAVAAIHEEKLTDLPPAVRPAETQAADSSPTGTTSKRVTTAEYLEQQSGVKVKRGGGSAPGALIITVPPDLGIHLAAAPDPRLVEKTRFGSIPKIGADGARPAEIYARPVVTSPALKAGAPRIALLVGGMGLDPTATEAAIATLPGAVTLGFAPYGAALDHQAAQAREQGHEIVLQLPMEPFDYPRTNPGPHTLLTTETAAEKMEDLHWLMSRLTGYAGVANFLGAKLTAEADALTPILREIGGRGLYYTDDATSAQSLAPALAPDLNLPLTQADVILDNTISGGGLEAALIKLEAIAREKGIAVGVASGLPSTAIDRIAHFAQALEAKGINLIPLSATLNKNGRSPLVSREP